MASRSLVTGAGGSEARNRRPYPIVRSRGSRTASTPRSLAVPQQPPEPLLQREDGERDLVLAERVAAARA